MKVLCGFGLFFLTTAVAFGQAPYLRDRDRTRLGAFPNGTKLERKAKEFKGAKPGTLLAQKDVVRGGPKENAEILFADRLATVVKPASVVVLERIDPPRVAEQTQASLEIQVKKGTVQVRTDFWSTLTSFKINNSKGLVTAPKGTIFQMRVTGNIVEVVVAEGSVNVYRDFDDPDFGTIVNEFEKLRIVDNEIPPDPQPVDFNDRATIRELLSLPVRSLRSYRVPATLTAQDAENVAIARISESLPTALYSIRLTPGKRNVVVYDMGAAEKHESERHIRFFPKKDWPRAGGFSTIDANGKRFDIGANLSFEALTLDGRTLYGSSPTAGLVAMGFDGKNRRKVGKKAYCSIYVAPDGKRIIASVGWDKYHVKIRRSRNGPVVGKKYFWQARNREWVVLNSSGTVEKALHKVPANESSWYPPPRLAWRRAGTLLFAAFDRYETDDYRFYRIDGTTPKPLGNFDIDPETDDYVSPLGKWALVFQGSLQRGVNRLLRLSDGKLFSVPSELRFVEVLPTESEMLAVDDAGQNFAVNIENGALRRAVELEKIERYPTTARAISADGKLIAYVTNDGYLAVGRADRPSMRRQLPFGLSSPPPIMVEPTGLEWLSATRIRYEVEIFRRGAAPAVRGLQQGPTAGFVDLAVRKPAPPPPAESAGVLLAQAR